MSQTLWISHRGFSESATENTAEAFRAARQLGFTHLETDLRSTADGELVLVHDKNLKRIAGQNLDVGQTASNYLRRVRLTGGEKLLFFSEFMEEFNECHWILDIKPEQGMRTLEALAKWWQTTEYQDFFNQRVRFLFWQKKQQDALLQKFPQAVCMARVEECRRAGLACLMNMPTLAGIRKDVTYALPPRLMGKDLMRPEMVAKYRQQQGRVLSYLPADNKQTRHSLVVGVDEILTNGRPQNL
ncbi:MAG TPA: glycerophosphodiester phosphodiesterase family protein [Cellvibrionaceae bacterium]